LLVASEVRHNFGNLYETMVTLWCAVSGGNDWMTYGEQLRSLPSGELYFFIFLFYIAFCLVGLFNVVTGVFVDSAVCVRTEDEVVASYMLDLQETTAQIKTFFKEADTDGSGTLSFQEFAAHLKHDNVRAYFAGLGVDPDEALIIFNLLDVDRSNEVLIDEFVNGTMKMKGAAKSMDVLCLMHDSAKITTKIHDFQDFVEEQLAEIHAAVRKVPETKMVMAWPEEKALGIKKPMQLEYKDLNDNPQNSNSSADTVKDNPTPPPPLQPAPPDILPKELVN